MFSLQKITVTLIFLLAPLVSAGTWYVRPAAGAGEAGMAFACVMKPGIWSSFHNQANLPLNTVPSFSFSRENRFGLKELSTRSACVIIPSGNGAIGALYSYFGYSDYRREVLGLASGIRLSPGLSAGVQADLLIERSPGQYKDCLRMTFEAGFLAELSENVKAGIHVFNPVPDSFRRVALPSAIRAGAGITLPGNLFAGLEAEMASGRKPGLKAGFEYQAGAKIRLRGGYSTSDQSFSFGFGFTMRPAVADVSFSAHPLLGITSCLSVSFFFREPARQKQSLPL